MSFWYNRDILVQHLLALIPLLRTLPLQHPRHPRLDVGIVVHVVLLLLGHLGDSHLPREEGDVGVRAPPAHQPLLAFLLLAQVSLQHGRDAVHLLNIPVHGQGYLLGREQPEPAVLAVVRTLPAGLEEEPLLGVVGLGRAGSETQLVRLVVALDEVLDDGAGLPEGDARVGVVDGGEPAVGVDGEVLGLLEVRQWDGFGLVGHPELFEDHGHLGRVGAAFTPDFDGFELVGHVGF